MPEILETSQLLAHLYEPKRKFRWLLSWQGLDAFVLKTCQRPQITFEESVIDYINTKRYVAGKGAWNPIQVTMNDPVSPSAARKVFDWVRLVYEPKSGRMGYATIYKKTVQLKLLDPAGSVVEIWTLTGTWPQDVNFGDLDMASSDLVEIACTLRFDNAHLE
jgi:hypothetical protein